MRLFLHLVLSGSLYSQIAIAQGISDNQPPKIPVATVSPAEVSEVVDWPAILMTLFSSVKTLEYVSEQNHPGDPYYGKLLWREIGPKYYYEFSAIDHASNYEIKKTISYDGHRTYFFVPSVNQIKITDGQLHFNSAKTFDTPLVLFSFLKQDDGFITKNDFDSSADLWKNLKSRISYLGKGRLGGRECQILRFSNCFNRDSQKMVTYEVYFDSRNLWPLGWKAFDLNNEIIEELEVVDSKVRLGDRYNVTYFLPSRIKITQWQNVMVDGVSKRCSGVREEIFKDVAVNSLSDEDVTIDPSIAGSIYDENSKRIFVVPK